MEGLEVENKLQLLTSKSFLGFPTDNYLCLTLSQKKLPAEELWLVHPALTKHKQFAPIPD